MEIPSLRHSVIGATVRVAVGLLALAGVAGCTSNGGEYGSIVTDGQKAQIVKGKTTQTEVLKSLGNPDQKIDLGDGKEQFSYIKQTDRTSGSAFSLSHTATFTEYWIVFEKGVVVDTGEQATTKHPNYFK